VDDPGSKVSGDHQVQLAIALVTAHLRACPHAADTILGISQWWLGKDAASISSDALERALRHLVETGVLGTRLLPSGQLLWYALNVPTTDPATNKN
jgi:hypothetical protein